MGGVILPHNIPFALVVLCIQKSIAHLVNFFLFFWMEIGFLFVDPHTIIFPGKVINQGIHSRKHIVQPLPIFFFYKGLAH